MNTFPFCVDEDLTQNILKEIKAIDCANVSDCIIIEKIKAFYNALYNKKIKTRCFCNDLRIEKFNIYNNLSCSASSLLQNELYERTFKIVRDREESVSCDSYACQNDRYEERFWLLKSHMVQQKTSLGFPLVFSKSNNKTDVTYLYFQRYKTLYPNIPKDKYQTFQKLIILYELKCSSMLPSMFCCDYLDNYSEFEMVIRLKDANFVLKNPTKIIILSPRCNLIKSQAEDIEYLSLLSAEEKNELVGDESFEGTTILELIFKSYFRYIQVDNLIFRNDDIFDKSCRADPKIGKLFGYQKSLGFVMNRSKTSCDLLAFSEPNNKGRYQTFLITVTDFSLLKPIQTSYLFIAPYITII